MTARLLLGLESLRAGNGGICRVARLMSRVLAEAGYPTHVCVLSDREQPPDLPGPIMPAGGSRARFVGGIWTNSAWASHCLYDFVGMARANFPVPPLRRPFLTFICGIEVWNGWTKPAYLRAARRADMLLSISAYTRDRAQREVGGLSHARVCWLGTESDCLPDKVAPLARRPSVLILGRIEPNGYKGHRELLEAWPKVVTEVPDAQLVIAGGGEGLPELKRRAACVPNVDVLGFVSEDKLNDLWRQATVFAMPSRGEGFGLVYIEAMRYGLPVIASVHDAAPEVNIDGQTGYNVNLDASDQLSDRLIRLLKDPDHAAALGANGRKRWAEHFRYSAFRDRFLAIVQEWAGPPPP